MSLSINQVVNAQIAPVPMAAARRDLSMSALFTPETGQAFTDGQTRYVTVSSAQDVANLFGSASSVYKAAQALFSVRPKPNKAIVARWAKEKQVIPAVASALNGGTLSVGIDTFKRITDGAFSLMVDGNAVVIGALDFSSAADLKGVAGIIAAAIPKDAVFSSVWDDIGKRIIFQAKKAGAQGAPTFGYAIKPDAGTYIGDLLKLEDGQASRIDGQDAAEVAQETPAEALGKLENIFQNWYGAYFADALTDEKLMNAHDWIASAPTSKVLAFTALRDEQLAWDNTNTLKVLAEKNSGRLMVQYNKTGDDHAAAALLGIALSTNWNAINSAKTVKFKQQTTVQSDDRITLNEAEKARRLGVNFYTDYDGVAMLAEGAMLGGTFIDEIVGLDAFLDACQKQAFSTLQGNPGKISQTDKGQAMLIGSLITIGEEFVRNGFLAGGIWRGNDVGELTYGDRLDAGYYFYSDTYDLQSIADREARKAMPIMCAIKLAGAIHSVDLLIQFNR
ncbi:DUF3383 domain-containing protein [Yersinia pestis subsp. pestis]|uniref:Phage-related protein n=17 Tax=Yersinia pestis TaxID=632 RepID=A0A0K1H0K5_YERPE|nr:DUF3383 domain-containing protein [Yersinia pestis]AKT73164.1 Phage-related protein [Yersinia pestis]MBP1376046.1 DUF3383 domain-containing protein [Yersinia pestis subsp. pestis]MBP1397135.1 DUF3383 domain-containing protein [Yersinia pestis subsp. pestis]MCF2964505.1 DUF3383 domain-containing protein [Yersinia pestis subsp. pestis]PVF31072.1 hypothetical protein A9317_15270 [Yersinia pestis]